jgi:hypothetical protein
LVLVVALAAACAKDKTTALDVKVTVTGTGDLDQLNIDAIQVGTKNLDLTGEQTKFPAMARKLRNNDVVTIWFADSADMQSVVVTATGLLCGKTATAPASTQPTTLAKGQTVQTTLTLVSNGTVCENDGGSGGAGGASGASGGAAGTSGGGAGGNAGSAGTGAGGMGGTAGVAGAAGGGGRGGTTGTAGTGGAAGRGGTTGTAGTGGAAGRGGTTGTAGTGGAAGRGGTTGTAGTGGAAGRGGTTGTAGTGGAAGRGGTTGTGGAGATCGTTPIAATAQPGFTQTGMAMTTCGYPIAGAGAVQYIQPQGSDAWAVANSAVLSIPGIGNANCGRCVRIDRMMSGVPPRSVVVTLVGVCPDPVCQADSTPHFAIGPSTYTMLATQNEPSLPAGANETLTYSFVPCQVSANQTILANFKISGGAVPSVLFVQHRYGIASATVEDPTVGQPVPLFRGNDGYWARSDGNSLPSGTIVPTFRLTDVNNSLVMFNNLPPTNTPPFASTGQQFPLLCTP